MILSDCPAMNGTPADGKTLVKDLYRYIWSTSSRSQIYLSTLSIAVFLLELAPLELQRRIVNGAVEQRGLKLVLMLCLVYVGVAVLHGALKLVMSVYRGSVMEAANQRLRMQIDPTGGARSDDAYTEKGVKVSIVVSEVEAVGGFVGSSFCDPLLNAGILVSVFGYMLVVQPSMAMVALAIFLPQLLFIPFLQNAINLRTKHRIKKLRAMSVDIVNDEAAGEEATTKQTFRQRIGDVYELNMEIYVRKYGMNFLMNLIYTLGVIGILAVGGWLLLEGKTEVGTIVAFISGLSRMNGPWGELVNYFRDLTNAGLKFRMIATALGRSPELSSDPT
jgi:ABC-type bacteriocin/lantibiotic exporter with double-glycine peptidase domain